MTSGGAVDVDTVMSNQPHHGVALDFHGHLLVTVAETVGERSVPIGVIAYDHNDTSTPVHESETCTTCTERASLGITSATAATRVFSLFTTCTSLQADSRQ